MKAISLLNSILLILFLLSCGYNVPVVLLLVIDFQIKLLLCDKCNDLQL